MDLCDGRRRESARCPQFHRNGSAERDGLRSAASPSPRAARRDLRSGRLDSSSNGSKRKRGAFNQVSFCLNFDSLRSESVSGIIKSVSLVLESNSVRFVSFCFILA